MKKEDAVKFNELRHSGIMTSGMMEYQNEEKAEKVIREIRRVLNGIAVSRSGNGILLRPINNAQLKFLADITGAYAWRIFPTTNTITHWRYNGSAR
ncbi:hypothetical protein [Anaerolinea sp.]|uniref:hypothetical protein n=1 Tax=Anaerolinea sp. TaxID=1872519 RepID=UPI002ACE2E5E|nr:hypothetical protein [Anaerolinea sp.]